LKPKHRTWWEEKATSAQARVAEFTRKSKGIDSPRNFLIDDAFSLAKWTEVCKIARSQKAAASKVQRAKALLELDRGFNGLCSTDF